MGRNELPAEEAAGYGTWPCLWPGTRRGGGNASDRPEHDCRPDDGAGGTGGAVSGRCRQRVDGRGGADFCNDVPCGGFTAFDVWRKGGKGTSVLGSGGGAPYGIGCGGGDSAVGVWSGRPGD